MPSNHSSLQPLFDLPDSVCDFSWAVVALVSSCLIHVQGVSSALEEGLIFLLNSCLPQDFVTVYINQSSLYLFSIHTRTNFSLPAFLLFHLSCSNCFLYRKIYFRCIDCFQEDYTHSNVFLQTVLPPACLWLCLAQSLAQPGSALAMILYFTPDKFVLFLPSWPRAIFLLGLFCVSLAPICPFSPRLTWPSGGGGCGGCFMVDNNENNV